MSESTRNAILIVAGIVWLLVHVAAVLLTLRERKRREKDKR